MRFLLLALLCSFLLIHFAAASDFFHQNDRKSTILTESSVEWKTCEADSDCMIYMTEKCRFHFPINKKLADDFEAADDCTTLPRQYVAEPYCNNRVCDEHEISSSTLNYCDRASDCTLITYGRDVTYPANKQYKDAVKHFIRAPYDMTRKDAIPVYVPDCIDRTCRKVDAGSCEADVDCAIAKVGCGTHVPVNTKYKTTVEGMHKKIYCIRSEDYEATPYCNAGTCAETRP